VRVFLLTAAALSGFAANSLLTRAAVGAGRIDAATFMAIRLVSGALTLTVIVRARQTAGPRHGSWRSAAVLAGYAIFFTLAYVHITAAIGALVLFGSVQITMIATGLVRGERPHAIDWSGLALAVAGLLVFTVPGATAPDLGGTLLMTAAGIFWGAYSLAGRAVRDPLSANAGNFLRASAFGVIFWLTRVSSIDHPTTSGVWLAIASGSLASGVAYTLWYAALPSLSALRAAIVQLLVPILTAVAASVILQEAVTVRLVAAAVLVSAGVALTVAPISWRVSPKK
jgi:drug/metabolite transporter (DMT)-like permease